MITNGTLLDKHINVIKKHVDRLYISIDCPEEIHNKIRRKRAHLKILSAIKKPNHSKETVISVTAENILNTLPGFSDNFNSLNIKSLYLQDMIVLSKHKRDKYKLIMKKEFNIDAQLTIIAIDDWIKIKYFRVNFI